jgi:hypothetical protein
MIKNKYPDQSYQCTYWRNLCNYMGRFTRDYQTGYDSKNI